MNSLSRSYSSLVPFGCALLVSSCATIQADSDYYRATDFSKYHTYVWVAETPLVRSQSSRVEVSALTVQRIRDAIDQVLQNKGFQLATSRENAEIALSFTVGARDLISMSDYPANYQNNWDVRPPGFGAEVTPSVYTEGTLGVDVFDIATREPVWHARARKTIVGADIDDPEKTISEVVDSILANFPPK